LSFQLAIRSRRKPSVSVQKIVNDMRAMSNG
jgi:hypothetical protein